MQYLALWIPLALSCVYLISQQITLSASLGPKVFVIGLSKTGTTSIGDALALLGYKRFGWMDIRSRQLVHTFIHGDIGPAVEQTRYFDAFEDLPWPFLYKEMAEMYPDAKFILSLRKDEQTWMRSYRRHMSRGNWEPALYFYGTTGADGDAEIAVRRYLNHTENVREYFHDKPDRYAEMIIDDGDANWEILCKVAQCPQGRTPSVGFPRINTAAHWHDGEMLGKLHRSWMWVVARMEEQLSDLYYKRQWPILNRVLELIWHYISVVDLAVCQLYFKFAVENQPPLPTK